MWRRAPLWEAVDIARRSLTLVHVAHLNLSLAMSSAELWMRFRLLWKTPESARIVVCGTAWPARASTNSVENRPPCCSLQRKPRPDQVDSAAGNRQRRDPGECQRDGPGGRLRGGENGRWSVETCRLTMRERERGEKPDGLCAGGSDVLESAGPNGDVVLRLFERLEGDYFAVPALPSSNYLRR